MELRKFYEALLTATDGALRYLWNAACLACVICLLLFLADAVTSKWLAAVGWVIIVLEVPTIIRVVAVYRRRSTR
ncbi:MAG: hypothetical protein LBV34_08025 [Nocardiopsaceae bacterium]|jgi:hypothetical protein|nr:hypothetical protein [Nocardiopsaceae bacterium]